MVGLPRRVLDSTVACEWTPREWRFFRSSQVTKSESAEDAIANPGEVGFRKNWLKVASPPVLVPFCAKKIKSFKAYRRRHVTFCPPDFLLKWWWQWFSKFNSDDVINLVYRLGSGQLNHSAEAWTIRQRRDENDGGTPLFHFRIDGAPLGIVTKQDRSIVRRVFNAHVYICVVSQSNPSLRAASRHSTLSGARMRFVRPDTHGVSAVTS